MTKMTPKPVCEKLRLSRRANKIHVDRKRIAFDITVPIEFKPSDVKIKSVSYRFRVIFTIAGISLPSDEQENNAYTVIARQYYTVNITVTSNL